MGKRRGLIGALTCAMAVMVVVFIVTRGSAGLVGNQNAGSLSGVQARPGQPADSIGWLVNDTGQTVTLESANVLPMDGFRTPRLVGVAVRAWNPRSRGLGVTGGGATGWPPSQMARTVPLAGYRLESGGGVRHHTALIVFGVASRSVGRFAVAGVTVTARVGDDLVHVRSIGPLLVCVATEQHPVPCSGSYAQRALRVANSFE